MNKTDVYNFLQQQKIWYEVTEHEAVYNMVELSAVELPYPDADAKNLFLRDGKKKNYYLITVKGDKRVDLKEFRKNQNTSALSFVSENDLMAIMKLIPGAVTPFGLLNDEERTVQFYIDREFFDGQGLVGVHPNDNTATVWLKAEDLVEMIRSHGNDVHIIEIHSCL